MASLRIMYIDLLKCFAIFLVIWGHCIQYTSSTPFLENNVFIFIYSFHMPLFFMLSGIFAETIFKKTLIQCFGSKFRQLIIPTIVNTVVIFFVSLLIDYINGNEVSYSIKYFISYIIFKGWFLKALFSSIVIFYVSVLIFRNKLLAIICSNIAVLLIPYFSIYSINFAYPFFCAGYLTGQLLKSSLWNSLNREGGGISILLILAALFTILFVNFRGNDLIYFSPIHIINKYSIDYTNLYTTCYRFTIGLTGSLFFILLFRAKGVSKQKIHSFFIATGQNTMGIFLLQSYFFVVLTTLLDFKDTNILIYSLAITPCISLLVLAGCLYMIQFIKRSSVISQLMIGSK